MSATTKFPPAARRTATPDQHGSATRTDAQGWRRRRRRPGARASQLELRALILALEVAASACSLPAGVLRAAGSGIAAIEGRSRNVEARSPGGSHERMRGRRACEGDRLSSSVPCVALALDDRWPARVDHRSPSFGRLEEHVLLDVLHVVAVVGVRRVEVCATVGVVLGLVAADAEVVQ